MSVQILGTHGLTLCELKEGAGDSIVRLTRRNANLIMEPGELADFAQGHKLLVNSSARIIILSKDESYLAKEGEYYYIFFLAKVDEQPMFIDSNYYGAPVTNRRVSHLQTLPPI